MRSSRTIQTNGSAKARAPGKIILTGEHFVVLGAPAVAMAINLYAHADVTRGRAGAIDVAADIPMDLVGKNGQGRVVKETGRLLEHLRLATRESLAYIGRDHAGVHVEVECGIPVGAGLGSSAATTVAIIAATARAQGVKLSSHDIVKIAFGPESFLHGKPSGVDHSTCTIGGVLSFRRPSTVKHLSIRRVPRILVCDSGVHRSTGRLVKAVVRRSVAEKKLFESHLAEVSEISRGAVRALRHGDDEELGGLLNRNHQLLVDIGVSNPRLDRLVGEALKAGALGAKLTGAGGGGCIIAVCEDSKSETKIGKALKRVGGTIYKVGLDSDGVVAWSGGEHSNRLGGSGV